MNDRHIVEMLLLPVLMHTTVDQSVDREKTPAEYDRIIGLLQTAIAEPLRSSTTGHRGKMLARVDRHRMEIVGDIRTTDELGLTVYVMMREISESVYQIGEGTPLHRAIELFLAALQHFADDEKLMRSAEKRGTLVMARLREQGLYQV